MSTIASSQFSRCIFENLWIMVLASGSQCRCFFKAILQENKNKFEEEYSFTVSVFIFVSNFLHLSLASVECSHWRFCRWYRWALQRVFYFIRLYRSLGLLDSISGRPVILIKLTSSNGYNTIKAQARVYLAHLFHLYVLEDCFTRGWAQHRMGHTSKTCP